MTNCYPALCGDLWQLVAIRGILVKSYNLIQKETSLFVAEERRCSTDTTEVKVLNYSRQSIHDSAINATHLTRTSYQVHTLGIGGAS